MQGNATRREIRSRPGRTWFAYGVALAVAATTLVLLFGQHSASPDLINPVSHVLERRRLAELSKRDSRVVHHTKDLEVHSPFDNREESASGLSSDGFTDEVQWDRYSLLLRGQRIFLL